MVRVCIATFVMSVFYSAIIHYNINCPPPLTVFTACAFICHSLSLSAHVLSLSLLMSYIYIYMELLIKPEILTSYMALCLAMLKAVSFCLLHNVSTLNQCRKLSCVTVVCKHFSGYQGYPNYRWDLIR
jgi:hypothetical protein